MVVAKYIRLSVEDDREEESESVGNQRLLLDEFLRTNQEFSDCVQEEFVDDGYSGVTMHRPALTALLDKVRFQSVQCIIVKDFSRFSRNYLDLGKYLEVIFPALGVRFLSVNDRYDSQYQAQNTALEIPFKGILNDFYSRDLSRKIISAKKALMQSGEISVGRAIYGYKKDPDSPMPYVVDEPAAGVVRQIFAWAREGKSASAIARSLTDRKVLPPALYKKRMGVSGWDPKRGDVWNGGKVNEILRDERYTGQWILGTYGSDGIRSPVKKDRSLWTRFDGATEPIVSKALFEEIQSMRTHAPSNRAGEKGRHVFYRKITCACCGMYLYRRKAWNKASASYFCRTPRLNHAYHCFQGHVQETALKTAVLEIINLSTLIGVTKKKRCRQTTEIWEDKKRQQKNIVEKSVIYERWKVGELERTEFLRQKRLLAEEKVRDNRCLEHAPLSGDTCIPVEEPLKREDLDKIVDHMEVYAEDRIAVYLKASDPFSGMKME